MDSLRRFFMQHRLTAGMLLFLAIFYAVALFGLSRQAPKTEVAPAGVSAPEVTREEFRQKEEDFKKNAMKEPRMVAYFTMLVLAILAAGLALDVWVLRSARRGRLLPGVTLPHGPAAWNGANVLTAIVFMFFSESVLLIIETIFFISTGVKDPPKDFLLMANSLLRDSFTAFFIIWFVTRKLGHRAADLGLTTRDFFRNVWRGMVGYVAILPPLFLSLIVLGMVAGLFSYEPAPQKVVQIYLKKSSDPYLLFFTFFVAGLGPIIEEIFFRGFTYKAFRQRFGVVRAMLLTSLIFALFHLSVAAFVPIFLLGLFLCYLYERTGSLVPSMVAHMAHNLIMVSLTLGFKSIAG